MNSSIILIGPVGAGKSTQAKLLAEKLNLPHRPLDELRWDYYREIGYDEAVAKRANEEKGILGVLRYWKPFEAHAVERVLQSDETSVIDFGGGHSVHEDPALFDRVRRALEPYPNVVFLLPSPDLDESVRLLRRWKWDGMAGEVDVHALFVKHHSNHTLAKFTVYTHGKTPEQTRDEILALIGME